MRKNFDLSAIRNKLAGTSGHTYWRSLDELARTEEFQDFLQHEFPQGADRLLDPVGRRTFLKLMAASLALGGLTACAPRVAEKIVPYAEAPEEIIPGNPLFFATAISLGGIATGVLAKSHQGRPTKLEGNPDHPGSLGSSDTFIQAALLDLYDPDRSQTATKAGLVTAWAHFLSDLSLELEKQHLTNGAGLRILTETVTSATTTNLIREVLAQFPQAKWHQYEPINRDNARQGARLAFGSDANPVYRFDQAEIILSLDADFLAPGPIGVRYARDFSQKRRVRVDKTDMNRLYMVETTLSVTGTMADHHLALSPRQTEALARALAARLGLAIPAPAAELLAAAPEKWLEALAEDLQAHQGRSLIVAGDNQPPLVHALAYALNELLGNVGQTVYYTEPLESEPIDQLASLRELVADMAAGAVELLLIVDANPLYNAPADLNLAENIQKAGTRIRLGLYEDETSALCQWHIPEKHALETWGDAPAYDGTITLIQPLIEPLYEDKSAEQIFAAMLGRTGLNDYDLVRAYWSNQHEGDNFEAFWRQSLYDGFMVGTARPERSLAVDQAAIAAAAAANPLSPPIGLEIAFRPDPTIWDGRFANNGWLQELPKPVSKLTWDNAAYVSPDTAIELGLTSGEMVELELDGRRVAAPVWVAPGQAKQTITLHLGYGRVRVGRVGNGIGVNAYSLRHSNKLWAGDGLTLRKLDRQYPLASTQSHYVMEGRELVRTGVIERFKQEPDFPHHLVPEIEQISLMPGYEYHSYAWGMVVDLNACTGCNACVTACQAENNIPIVGKDQVLNGREMHWIRLDSYFQGELADPQAVHQPMMCQHCEQAPCELVCPVNATIHDHEGLNVMVYNRCIGTRYCSNNCPYKVRRFNFLDFVDNESETLKMMRNPEVTVRVRGVMEKCSYCVQRISAARINAKKEGRSIRDGEVITACQSACPTQAITFGDVNDPHSQVAALKAEPHNYGILTELGTRPRTSYLARLKNPNPALVEETGSADEQY